MASQDITGDDKCPLQPDGNCPWSGSSRALIKHFKEDHAKRIVELDNNDFAVNIPYSTGTYWHLLMTEVYTIVLTISVNIETQMISFLLRNPLSAEPNKYTMKLFGNNPRNRLVYRSKFVNTPDKIPHSIKLDSLVVALGITNSIHSLFKFDDSCDNLHCKIEPTKLSQKFKCESCSELLTPQIVQCVEGHMICQLCLKKTNICPKCGDQVDSKKRMLGLENLYQEVCSFQSHNCIFADCSAINNFKDLKTHLIESHEIDTSDRMELVFEPEVMEPSKSCYFKLLYYHIFRIWFEYNETDVYWVVEVLFQQNSNVNFYYEVSASDENNPERNFHFQEMCLPPRKNREINYEDGIMVYRSQIETYSLTGRVKIQLKISMSYTEP